jgi:hypothetical protein
MSTWDDDRNPNLHDGNGRDNNSPWREIEIQRFPAMKANLATPSLVKGVLEHQQLSLIFGDTGCGKTFLALHLSTCIATGRNWLGHKTDQGSTVYIAAEAGRSVANRVAAIKHATGLFDVPLLAVTSPVDLCHTGSADLDRLIAAIKNAAKENEKIHHVTIDTVSRALAGGDENSSADMGAFVSAMDRLRDTFGAHVTAVHHTGKDTQRGARGHSLLKANLDTEIEVTCSGEYRCAKITKQRDGETGTEIPFRLRAVELGRNLDGDPVFSCVVEARDNLSASSRSAQNAPQKLSANAKFGLDQLRRAVDKYVTAVPASTEVPDGTVGVEAEIWKQYLRQVQLINPDGNEREQYRRMYVTLASAGCIRGWGKYVWLVQ